MDSFALFWSDRVAQSFVRTSLSERVIRMRTVSALAFIEKCVSFVTRPKRLVALAVLLSWSALLNASDLSRSHILVATPALRDNIYGSTVLVVKAIGGDQHVGFIVNRPAAVTLARMFPQHGPSQKITNPVYF